MRRIALPLIVAAIAAFGVNQASAAPACTRTATVNGDWAAPATWGGTVPVASDHVCIESGRTVTVASASVQTLQLGGMLTVTGSLALTGPEESSLSGTLAGAGNVTVAGLLTWTGGSMTGAGTTTVLAGARLVNDDYTTLAAGRVLDNFGTIELPTNNRYVSMSGAAPLLRNRPGATIRSSATGAGLRVPVENDGAIVSDGGDLELTQGGPASSGSYGGGAGVVRIGNGVHELAPGASLRDNFLLSGGTVAVADGATVAASGAATISGGTVRGPGGLSVTGTLTWAGGTMQGPGVTTVAAAGKLLNTGFTTLSDGRLLENLGTVELPTDNRNVSRSGVAPLIRNRGMIRRTATGTTGVDLRVPVENQGTILSDGGQLSLTNGGTGGPAAVFGGGAGSTRLQSGSWQLDSGARLHSGTVVNAALTIDDGTVTATGASLTGGAIAGAGTLAITGPFTWTGGTMGGTGITNVAEGATLALPAGGGFEVTGTRTVVVDGLLDARADNGLYGADSLLHIRPTGTLRKSGGTGWTFVDLPLRNDGAVEGLAGELRLSRGAAEPHTGRFVSASAQAFVALTGDGHVLTGAARLKDFTRIDGDVAVREGDTLELSDDVVQTSGELSGDVKVTGTLTWSGGSHEAPGATTIEVGGEIVVDAASGDTCAAASLGEARRLVNRGALRLINGSYLGAYGEVRPEIHNVGRLELDSAGTACGAYTGIAGDALVRNTGRIEKLGGAGSSFVGSSLENDGEIVNSTAGELRLESNTAIGHAGSFRGVVFDSGTFVLDPGASVEGDVAVEGAELRLPEGMTVAVPSGATLRLAGGSIAGAGSVSVSGVLSWSDGDLDGPGTTVIEPGGSARIAPTGDDDRAFVSLGKDGSLVIRGSVTVDDASVSFEGGASMLNRGTLELGDGTRLSGMPYGFGYGALLHNAGTLRTTAGSGVEATLPVDNDGVIEVGTGRLDLPELLNWSGSGFYGESGIAGGAYVVRGTLVVPGTANVNGARLTLDGADSRVMARTGVTGGLTDALAGLRRNAGGAELVLRGGRSLQVAGALANEGVLDVGPGSVLRANGFRQAAGAVLRPAVTAGGSGRVTSTGPAELGGRLDTPGAASVAGETTVLTAPSVSGAFAAITGAYQVVVGATDVRLVAPATVGPLAAAPAEAGELRIDGAALAVRGPWERRGGYLVARRGGATLTARGVRGDALALVARTCRRCGAVRVTWAGKQRVVSLRSRRAARRTIRVFGPGRGTVRVRTTSARRVAIDALVVTR